MSKENSKKSKKNDKAKLIYACELVVFTGMLVALSFFSWFLNENELGNITNRGLYYAGCIILLSCILANCIVSIILILERRVWEANRVDTKSKFLATLSHEIRTPINAVLGLNEAILRESNEDAIIGYSADVDSAGRMLLSLVDNLLDISKLDSGKMKLMSLEYSVRSLVLSCASMVEKRARDKNLQFLVEVEPDMPSRLFGDEVRLQQIVVNLLSNAIKYTKAGWVELKVTSERVNEERLLLKIQVSDTGIGIKKEDQSTLFDDFARIDDGKNVGIEGAGLGLSIVGRLIRLMEGTIGVESTYGKGSTFTITVPQKVMDTLPVGYITAGSSYGQEKARVVADLFTAPTARILAVDDVLVNLRVIQSLLKKTGIKIDTAINGSEALDLVRQNKYDVILLDHLMPGKDGIETLHDMKNISGDLNRHTPVIMITANAISGAREEYLEEGFADYISKPFSLAELQKMLLKYLPVSKIEGSNAETKTAHERYKERTIVERRKITDAECIADKVPDIINKVAAREACHEDEVLFHDRLATFISEDKRELLKSAHDRGDLANYKMIVRSIRASAQGIGAVELAMKAVNVESAIETGERIEETHEELTVSYSEAITDIMREKVIL